MVGYCWRFGGGVFFFPHVLGKEAQNLARRATCEDQSEGHATTTCILDFSLHFFLGCLILLILPTFRTILL